VTLEFLSASHEYRFQGRKLPSVTTVLRPYYDGLEHMDPDKLAMLALFGTHVHQTCHLFNIGMLDRDSLTPAIDSYLAGWEKCLDESGLVVLESETRVLNEELGYAGTLDVIGMFPKQKREVVIDIKTGTYVPRTVGPQTAAYNAARGKRVARYCCLLQPNAYKLVPLDDPRDFDIFKAALTLHRWSTGE